MLIYDSMIIWYVIYVRQTIRVAHIDAKTIAKYMANIIRVRYSLDKSRQKPQT